jgi:hypothetical protein
MDCICGFSCGKLFLKSRHATEASLIPLDFMRHECASVFWFLNTARSAQQRGTINAVKNQTFNEICFY